MDGHNFPDLQLRSWLELHLYTLVKISLRENFSILKILMLKFTHLRISLMTCIPIFERLWRLRLGFWRAYNFWIVTKRMLWSQTVRLSMGICRLYNFRNNIFILQTSVRICILHQLDLCLLLMLVLGTSHCCTVCGSLILLVVLNNYFSLWTAWCRRSSTLSDFFRFKFLYHYIFLAWFVRFEGSLCNYC